MERWADHSITYLLIGIIIWHVEADNAYSKNDDEFSRLHRASFYDPQFIFEPLGLNFEFGYTKVDTEAYGKFTTASSAFPLDEEEVLKDRNDVKERPKIINTAYDSIFDREYMQKLNYSEIYEQVKNQEAVPSSRMMKFANYSFTSFPSLDEVYEHLSFLERQSKGRAVIFPLQKFNSGWNIVHTRSHNEILSIRISGNSVRAHEENPIIVVVAGIHGRDWYAVQSAIFAAEQLILNRNDDIDENFDWWIVPILNPDGYQISHVNSEWRNWKKNLQEKGEVHSKKCFGVDLDLGFEYQWLSCNASLCDSDFPGEEPFSVPETQGLRDTLEAFEDNLETFVALKEGRQSLVYPFSDTLDSPRNVRSIDQMCKKALETFVKHVDGVYDYGQSSHVIEMRAGFIEDWAKIYLGVEKSFAFYLGPTKKDRRELKNEHLMEHTSGTFEVLKVLAKGKISSNILNSSNKLSSSFIYFIYLSTLCLSPTNLINK